MPDIKADVEQFEQSLMEHGQRMHNLELKGYEVGIIAMLVSLASSHTDVRKLRGTIIENTIINFQLQCINIFKRMGMTEDEALLTLQINVEELNNECVGEQTTQEDHNIHGAAESTASDKKGC